MLSRLLVRSASRSLLKQVAAPAAVAAAMPLRRALSRSAAVAAPAAASASSASASPADLFLAHDVFEPRHLGPSTEADQAAMLKVIGMQSLEELIAKTIPASIRTKSHTQQTNNTHRWRT